MIDKPIAAKLVQQRVKGSLLDRELRVPEGGDDFGRISAALFDTREHEGFEHASA